MRVDLYTRFPENLGIHPTTEHHPDLQRTRQTRRATRRHTGKKLAGRAFDAGSLSEPGEPTSPPDPPGLLDITRRHSQAQLDHRSL